MYMRREKSYMKWAGSMKEKKEVIYQGFSMVPIRKKFTQRSKSVPDLV